MLGVFEVDDYDFSTMKILAPRSLAALIVLLTATVAFGAGMPSMDVTVSDSAGKVAYKGKTNAEGAFSTARVAPGDYVVQFVSRKEMKGDYGLVVSAGKQKIVADVQGQKFASGGVAMRVKVGKGMNVTGQVTSGKLVAAATRPIPKGVKMKVENGKRYFWKTASTGSNAGGRWVEEGTPEAANITNLSSSAYQDNLQSRSAPPQGN